VRCRHKASPGRGAFKLTGFTFDLFAIFKTRLYYKTTKKNAHYRGVRNSETQKAELKINRP
jgi:hypothetical protein